jgi:hypothetical protein
VLATYSSDDIHTCRLTYVSKLSSFFIKKVHKQGFLPTQASPDRDLFNSADTVLIILFSNGVQDERNPSSMSNLLNFVFF